MTQMNVPPNQGPEGSVKLVVLALILAVVAVVLVNVYVLYVKNAAKPQEETVYRLTIPVAAGEKLKKSMYEAYPVDKEYFKALGSPLPEKFLVNRLGEPFVRSANQGQVLTSDLFDASNLKRLDADIAIGKRAVALPVNSRELPGSLKEQVQVDVLAPFIMGSGRVQVLPVIENVRVVVAGNNSILDEPDDGSANPVPRTTFRRIEINVSPQEALDLARIKKIVAGDFEILVRNPNDKQFQLIPNGGINPEVLNLLSRTPAPGSPGPAPGSPGPGSNFQRPGAFGGRTFGRTPRQAPPENNADDAPADDSANGANP